MSDLDAREAQLRRAVGGARQALEELRRGGADAHALYEAAVDVRVAEESLAWFLFETGSDDE